jgi:hypothetical protein
MVLPPLEGRKYSKMIANGLQAIRYGEVEDKFGWMISMI